ncbi:hypothetical protein MKX01_018181 [Papaver californicum]|nr:hypothetical protein MKX01_018181 [Papaver californicum]
MGNSKENFLIVFVVLFCLGTASIRIEGGRTKISIEENKKLERQLEFLNKPPVKTIHTAWGDTVDCIDINKQLAFDHPLLENHKIQMKPTFNPKEITSKTGDDVEPLNFRTDDIECPEGTVPNRRTTKEELIKARSFFQKNKSPNLTKPGLSVTRIIVKNGDERKLFHGASADMDVHKPLVAEDQYSATQFWIENGDPDREFTTNSLQAGWIVSSMYSDDLPRLFGYWTSNDSLSTRCYNNFCPGFVQVHKSYYLGIPIFPLSTQERRSFIRLSDKYTGNWWLGYGPGPNEAIGYWPNNILTNLEEGADRILFGGSAGVNKVGIGPQMGNGYILHLGPLRECELRNMEYINYDGEFVAIGNDLHDLDIMVQSNCGYYNVDFKGDGNVLAMGGPGGKCFRPQK